MYVLLFIEDFSRKGRTQRCVDDTTSGFLRCACCLVRWDRRLRVSFAQKKLILVFCNARWKLPVMALVSKGLIFAGEANWLLV